MLATAPPPAQSRPLGAMPNRSSLRAPANKNEPTEPVPGVDKLGRPYHKDPDNQRFTKKPDDAE